MSHFHLIRLTILMLLPASLPALEYPYVTVEPQKAGWPLPNAEREYVLKPEHDSASGREANKHVLQLWPVVPTAGHFGGDAWLKLHAAQVQTTLENKGPTGRVPLDGQPVNTLALKSPAPQGRSDLHVISVAERPCPASRQR